MIFRRSLSKKKGAAYSFFSGLSAGFVPAMLMALLQTLMMAVIPLIIFINMDFGNIDHLSDAQLSKDAFKFYTYGVDDTATLYLILGALGILSILVAVRLFSFICDKKTVNVFYSLGIKRRTLFISKYFAGAVLLIAANIIPVILSYIVNLIFIGPSWQLSLVLLHLYCGLSVFSLICYSVASVVFSSVGTVSEAIVYSVALLFAPTIILFITEQIIGAFLPTSTYNIYLSHFTDTSYNYDHGSSLLDATSAYNPLLFFAEELRAFSRGDLKDGQIILVGTSDNEKWHIPNLLIHFPWFIIAIALGVLGALLFRRIKAENCGFLNTNKVLSNLTIFELCLFGSSIMLSEIRWTSAYVVIGIGVLAAFGLYIIAEIFLKRNFLKILKSLYKFVAHMAVIALIFGICATGGFGYSNYIPDKSKVESVEVALPFSYAPITTKNSDFGWNTDGFVRINESYRYTFMPVMTDSDDIDKVMELNRKITLDEADDGTKAYVIIRYNYKNGKYSERRHTLTNKNETAALFTMFDTKAFKDELKELFYGFGGVEEIKKLAENNSYVDESVFMRLAFDYDYSEITFRAASLHENRIPELTKEQFTALKDAVFMDLSDRKASDYFLASSKQLGVLSFGVTDEAWKIEGVNGYSYNNTIIEEDMTVPVFPEELEPSVGEITDEFTDITDSLPEEEPSIYKAENSIPYSSLGGIDYEATYDVIVTEDMTNTLAVLKNAGYEGCFTSALTIEAVSFREYSSEKIFSYYSSSSNSYVHDFFSYPTSADESYSVSPDFADEQSENKITDKTKIAELDSLMRIHEYTFDSGYFCLIRYSDGSYCVRYLSYDDAPDYVKNYNYKMPEDLYYY